MSTTRSPDCWDVHWVAQSRNSTGLAGGCGGCFTQKHNKWKQLSRRHKLMIESFLRWTLIGGQALYWLFLKYETEIFSEESWQMCVARMGRELKASPSFGGSAVS